MGGDEFAIALAYEPNFPVVIRSLAAALVKAISNRFDVGEHHVHVGASIGLASSDTAGWLVETMLRQADVAMYRAKQDGRNRFCWFDGTMEADLKERSQIEGDLRTAIPTGQIVPYYQPQIDMETGEISGFEVLARWEHPTRGLVPPDRFIAIAEECGLISELSLCLMRQAMTDARDWASHLTIAVNISPTQLRDPLLAQRILKILVETRFAPQRLEIEITETALVTDLTTAKAVVSSLKNQGVRLALDDFGTGYSSLHHLRALPFDKIKIDRSFVGSMLDNSESAAIVGAVLKLGESLGMTVTAEGVETHAVAQHLSDLRCGNAQGWLYSKALTRSDAVRLLEPCPDALNTTLRDAC